MWKDFFHNLESSAAKNRSSRPKMMSGWYKEAVNRALKHELQSMAHVKSRTCSRIRIQILVLKKKISNSENDPQTGICKVLLDNYNHKLTKIFQLSLNFCGALYFLNNWSRTTKFISYTLLSVTIIQMFSSFLPVVNSLLLMFYCVLVCKINCRKESGINNFKNNASPVSSK